MRDLIDKINQIIESTVPSLKKDIVSAVKTTDDERVLSKVLDTLRAGNLEERIDTVLERDPDAKRFLDRIVEMIVKIPAPIEEKDQFLKRYPSGILDVKKLLDGKSHSFADLVGAGFPAQLMKLMSTELTSQGVGPGEVALAVLSPSISWSGRAAGGGDITVGKLSVEVKTSVASGGRWINARKATMDMAQIKRAIVSAIESTARDAKQDIEIPAIPARTSVPYWVDTLRPLISKKYLAATTQEMADGLFNHADNSRYQKALATGSVQDIVDALLDVGYENYKAYSGFDGMLLMDVPTETSQYFKDYSSMRGKIKNETPYILGPEAEAMPKVSLLNLDPERSKKKKSAEEPAEPQGRSRSNVAPAADKPVARPKTGSQAALGRRKK